MANVFYRQSKLDIAFSLYNQVNTSYLDAILFTENSVQNFTEKGQVPLDHP